jgi:hypothetical protein
MEDAKNSIFRSGAVQRYLQRREEAILPRFISPPTWTCLWLLLCLLMAGGLVAWSAKMPVYVSGSAVIGNWPRQHDSIDATGKSGEIVVIAFLPAEYLSRLRVGQTLFLQMERSGGRLGSAVMSVAPEVFSPEVARKMFAINAGDALDLVRPSAVAVARFEPAPSSLPVAAYLGSVYQVEIEVGSRRVISFLPLIGRFFGE